MLNVTYKDLEGKLHKITAEYSKYKDRYIIYQDAKGKTIILPINAVRYIEELDTNGGNIMC